MIYALVETLCYIQREIENGEVIVTDIRLGSTAQYKCNDGYTLVGPATRICLITGTFSGHTPVCVDNNTNRSKNNYCLTDLEILKTQIISLRLKFVS